MSKAKDYLGEHLSIYSKLLNGKNTTPKIKAMCQVEIDRILDALSELESPKKEAKPTTNPDLNACKMDISDIWKMFWPPYNLMQQKIESGKYVDGTEIEIHEQLSGAIAELARLAELQGIKLSA